MLLLAIDSATPTAGVALLEDDKILYESFANYKKTHSETLMPMVDQALQTCEKALQDLSALAISIGPGSFTGLRIGLAAAKGLSLAASIPVMAISTLEMLAHNLSGGETAMVAPLMDARKQEVYTGFYLAGKGRPQAISDEMAITPEQFVQQARCLLESQERSELIVLGDGIQPYQTYFQQALGEAMRLAPCHNRWPRAAVLADLAACYIKEEKPFIDLFHSKPVYLRLSEAEYRLGKGEL